MDKPVSITGIEALGFRAMDPEEEIRAAFYSIHIFEVQGLVTPRETIITQPVRTEEVSCRIAAGNSVNRLCQSIAGDDYTENESQWARDHKCTPPYVVVQLGPTRTHSCKQAFIKRHGSQLHTYDAFRDAHTELLTLEDQALPVVHTALVCSAAASGCPSSFKLVDCSRYGITTASETVFDVRLEFKQDNHADRPVTEPWLETTLANTSRLAATLDPQVARFMHRGIEEESALTRFLHCFLAVEIETNRAFDSIDQQGQLARLLGLKTHACETTLKLLARRPSDVQDLAERFAWCAHCLWSHLEDKDVEEFLVLKKIRDRITHGRIATPPPGATTAIERLAARLLAAPE